VAYFGHHLGEPLADLAGGWERRSDFAGLIPNADDGTVENSRCPEYRDAVSYEGPNAFVICVSPRRALKVHAFFHD
jgi:hypothetical protein